MIVRSDITVKKSFILKAFVASFFLVISMLFFANESQAAWSQCYTGTQVGIGTRLNQNGYDQSGTVLCPAGEIVVTADCTYQSDGTCWRICSCEDDCTSGCNACANYSYLSTSNYGFGSKSVSCVDDCGDTDWDTCYCNSCGTCDPYSNPGCPANYTSTNTGCSSTSISCSVSNQCLSSCRTVGGTCYKVRKTVNFYAGTGGYISGATTHSVCYGGDTSYVTAVPNIGYSFSHWSDGVTSPTRRVTNVTSNTSRTAYFKINTYEVKYRGYEDQGVCSPSSVIVNYWGSAGPPNCSRSGYFVEKFIRNTDEGGTCGGLNFTSGWVGDVACDLVIEAHWQPICTSGCNACANYSYLSTTNYGYGSKSVSCVDDCGDTDWDTCYCNSQCSPPVCPEGTSNEGDGNLYNISETTCTNNCLQPNSNYCYYDCQDAICTDLESEVEWTDTACPEEEEDCRTTTQTVDVTDPSPGCDTEQAKTCYIQNTRPQYPNKDNLENNLDINILLTTNVEARLNDSTTLLDKLVKKIRAQEEQSSVLGFTSNTYTGTRLNNPLTITSEYSDVDGHEDIEAVYLWWSTSDTKDFITPNRIANPTEGLTGQTQNNENFGFMIARDDTGAWENIYVPHIEGETKAWIYAGDISTTNSTNPVTIKGPGGLSMVNFSITDISPSDSDTIMLEVLKEYLWEDSNFEKVANAQYHIWTLANDTVGFLPFDEYDDIEDSEDELWKDSGSTWNIDLEKPVLTKPVSYIHLEEEEISLGMGGQDNQSYLARISLVACSSQSEPNNLFIGLDEYQLEPCDTRALGTENPDINMENGDNILGNSPINPGASQYIVDETIDELVVDLNGNSEGTITFYFTFMDEAGNWAQDHVILRLGEWAIVKGGLVYGNEGVISATRELSSSDVWDINSVLLNPPYNFEPTLIDITDIILLGGNSTATNMIRFLVRYSENYSFKAAKFPGVFLESVFSNLVSAYEDKKEQSTLNFEEINIDENLLNDLLSYCNQDTPPDFCILRREGDININSGFKCNGKGFLIATGNIIVNPDFINSNPQDACILLAKENIVIENGTDKITTPMDYDIIQAFLIAEGEIIIEQEATVLNGLLIEGGMVAFTPGTDRSAIYNQRELELEYRNNYPVLAVKHNSKYGLLSANIFGYQTTMYQIDIGFKPY